MKKTLVLVSALGLAGAACAQSSVTMFGIVDVTLAHGTGSVSDRTQLLRGGYSSNRLGFRGVEDLGGGMSAGFWLEAGLNPDDGSGQPTSSNNQASGTPASAGGGQGLTFNRRSTISLGGAWGEFRMGRDLTPQYLNLAAGDPFGNVGVGSVVNYTAIITGVTNTRASNSIAYFSPRLGGFAVHAMHYFGENSSGAATSSDGTGDGIRLSYENGPLQAALALSRTKYAAGDVKQNNANVTYNFGVVKATATYNSDRNGAIAAKGYSLGAWVPIGASEIRAAYSHHRTSAVNNPAAKKISLGYHYNLSKRSVLYTTFARVRNEGGFAHALNGAATAPNGASNGFDLGIRHSF
ncbi:porin [Ramlibacter sp. WS9]|uniref:porin n=1 Tax=Ramlibacter sp. WS9 TaxID=1882741 RepID=UPI001144E9F9|nr:porin [Ramlibacter sp. WS9]ROZ74376.1 porin [Ramlibacter sp. WS9]